MAISAEEKNHSVVLSQLALGLSYVLPSNRYSILKGKSRSIYYLISAQKKNNRLHECKVGIYIKSSNKRRSPWQYTFMRNHQSEIQELHSNCNEVFIVFVNYTDGIACLNHNELKEVLDNEFEDAENVSISRQIRQSYRVSGRDGNLNKPLARNVFPGKIIDYISHFFSSDNEITSKRKKSLLSFLLK